jgi:hypothetical protein
VTAAPDSDHDGIPDAKDGCMSTRGGPYDRNANGCPGPYPRMVPAFRAPGSTSEGFNTYSAFIVRNLAPGAAVTIGFRGSVEHRRATKKGSVASKLVPGKRVRRGTPITVRAVKPGIIGYAAKAVVITVSPAYRIVQVRCIAATGSRAPKPCSRVDRGK